MSSRRSGHLSWVTRAEESAALPMSAAAGILQKSAAIAAILAIPAISRLFVMIVPLYAALRGLVLAERAVPQKPKLRISGLWAFLHNQNRR
jgi:hypothetical protein